MFFSEKNNIHFEFLTKQIAADIKKGSSVREYD